MSRGPGKVEQAIEAAFAAAPDEFFMLDELVLAAYGVGEYDEYGNLCGIDKKYRVAAARAADKVCARLGWGILHCEQPGGRNVYFNKRSVKSYALARTRAEWLEYWTGAPTLRDLEQQLAKHPQLVEPGGAWALIVEQYTAELNGDFARVEAIEEERDRRLAALVSRWKKGNT